MSMLSLVQMNEVLKTSQAIYNSPVATAIRFAGALRHLYNALYTQSAKPYDALDLAVSMMPFIVTDESTGKSYVKHKKVKVAWGDLPGAERATAYSVDGGIHFSWHNNSEVGEAKADDVPVLIAYCKARGVFRFKAMGAERDTGYDFLATPDLRGQKVHTWLSFKSADGNEVANSVYTGFFQVL